MQHIKLVVQFVLGPHHQEGVLLLALVGLEECEEAVVAPVTYLGEERGQRGRELNRETDMGKDSTCVCE